MIEFNEDKIILGYEIGMQTLIGVDRSKYPVKRGNCFSLISEDKIPYQILNFSVENLEEAVKNHGLTYPVKMMVIDDTKLAILCDERIPANWYDSHLCGVCTPDKYLPITQQLPKILGTKCGAIVTRTSECGKFVTEQHTYDKLPKYE